MNNRGTDKEDIFSGILLRHKKAQKHAICRYVEGPRDGHT